jgi:CheY-like chemotaxis protein
MLQLLLHPGLALTPMTDKCVLVIDDEASVQWVIQSCLEDVAGWQVCVASSAREGLAIALEQKPGAIILDMMMPEMDGVGFLKARQAHPELQEIPVILLTAKVEWVETSRYQAVGAVGAIAKPFNPIQFVDQVAEVLGWPVDFDMPS